MRNENIQLVDAQELGQRIRQARERLGMSQEELAQLIARDQRAVSEYEHGKRRISVTELPRFAEALQVSLLYFYEGEVSLNDLDRAMLEHFQKLPSFKAKQSAIEIVKILVDTTSD